MADNMQQLFGSDFESSFRSCSMDDVKGGNMVKQFSSGGSGAANLVDGRQDASSRIEKFGMPGILTQAVAFTEVFGRDDLKQQIIEQLLECEPGVDNYMVIPIVGFGGLGKTSLAQLVYNNDSVVSHFDFKAWVSIPRLFDVKRVIMELIESATHGSVSCTDLNQSQEIFSWLLTGKRFLIVLDDVWGKCHDWELLWTSLSQGSNGSKVIITTRDHNVASTMTHNRSIKLSPLSHNCSWLLFQKLVGEVVEPEMMDAIMVCKGLPLAVKTLAGSLRKEEKSKWPKILEGLEKEDPTIMTILKLCFHRLPPHLKRVLSYCSIFPDNFIIEKKKLILMWMAEGFLVENDSMEMEDVGHQYFLDLVSRSFFDPSPSGEGLFTMHSLISDLARWAAGESCCCMDYSNVSGRTCHISFSEYVSDERLLNLAMNHEAIHSVRTFASFVRYVEFSRCKVPDWIPRFSYLRVVSFAHMRNTALPNSIGQLIHLRYADFSFTEIKELPRSMGKLLNLETLFLRHCKELQSLAKSTVSLSRLRHLDIFGTSLQEMPLEFGKLLNLRTLDRFVLGAGRGWTIGELKSMKYLRVLHISGLEHVVSKDDALEAKLYEKSNLLELHLNWGSCINEVDDDVLEQLRPSTSIMKCCLDGYRGLTFPAWLGDPSFNNLVELHLVGCEKLGCLPPLGHLPSLLELWVEGMHGIKQVGSEFYGPLSSSSPFPALRTLAFWSMKSWEKWSHSSVDNNWAFPCLQKLSIKKCPLLVGCLPPHLPCIEKLEFSHCENLEVPLGQIRQYTSLKSLGFENCPKNSSFSHAVLPKNLALRNI